MAKAPPRFSFSKRTERKAWQGNNAAKRKITGRALQRARDKLFARDPLCAECKKHGRVTIATIRDHKLALAFGGEDVEENTQGLCGPCHDAKSKTEAAEGRRRSPGGF